MMKQHSISKVPTPPRRLLRFFLWCTQLVLFAIVITCSKSTGPEPTRNRPPTVPVMASTAPPQGSSGQSIRPTLRWTCSDPDNDSLRYDVFFGIDSVPQLRDSQLTVSEFQPGTLQFDTKYFWRIVAKDGFGNGTSSPTWNFRTVTSPKLVATPASLDFDAHSDSMVLTLTYLGNDTIAWRASADQSWLTVIPDSGKISAHPETLLVVVARAKLASGTYNGNLQFSSPPEIALVSASITIGALTWQQVAVGIGKPPTRQSHSAIVDSISERLIIFGGWDFGAERNDIWTFDLVTSQWSRPYLLGTPPSPRAAHSACYDPVDRSMLIFGGIRANFTPTILGDLIRLNLVTDRWETLGINDPKPEPRFNHTAIYDPVEGEMVIYGGSQADTTFGDVWRFSFARSSWSKVSTVGSAPEPRDGHSAIYYPVENSMIVFGGWHNGSPSNDVWKLSLTSGAWTQVLTSGVPPAPRTRHSAVYYPEDESMILFGGQGTDNQEYNDVWTLNLKTAQWSQVPISGTAPSARSSQTLSYDPRSHAFFMYAGWSAGTNARTYLDDLWRLVR